MNHDVMTALVLIGAMTLASQSLARLSGLPAILFLLASGVLLVPTTGLIAVDAVFGDLLFPFVSLGVASLLFDGSLTLKLRQIAGHGAVVRNLVTFGPFITWAIVTLITYTFIGVSWPLALLFGSIMTVTGPTVLVPMLSSVRPKSRCCQHSALGRHSDRPYRRNIGSAHVQFHCCPATGQCWIGSCLAAA